jgi:hypothetical protein
VKGLEAKGSAIAVKGGEDFSSFFSCLFSFFDHMQRMMLLRMLMLV